MTSEPGSGSPMSDRMQSLLSRAVEDQLSEQRQTAVALGEVRTLLARIGQQVEALANAPLQAGPGASSEALVAAVSADVREAVRLLGERLDGVGRAVQQRGADLAEVKVGLRELDEAVRAQSTALTGLSSGLSALPAFGDRIGGLQDNLGELHARLGGLEELSASVATMKQQSEASAQEVRDLRTAFAGMAARVAELPGKGDLAAADGRGSEQLDALATRLTRIENALPGLREELAALREPLAEQAEVLGELRDRGEQAADEDEDGESLAERLDQISEALEELREQLSASPEEQEAGPEDDEPDELAAQVAEIHEALYGEDGLVARAGEDDELDDRIAAAVTDAVGESEARITAHVDEAILALAEALLRKRTPNRAAAGTAFSTAPATAAGSMATPAPAATLAPPRSEPAHQETESESVELDGAEDDEDLADVEDVDVDDDSDDGEDAVALEGADDASAADEVDDDEDDGKVRKFSDVNWDVPQPPKPWQTPVGERTSEEDAEASEPGDGDKSRKRRPWWRPSD